ncbi:hypothetical protein [Streptomyces sp. NPDC058545]
MAGPAGRDEWPGRSVVLAATISGHNGHADLVREKIDGSGD